MQPPLAPVQWGQRYPYAQWLIGHLILPTPCGFRPIRVARPPCVLWVGERWLDEKSPNRFAPLRWSRSRLSGVEHTTPLFFPLSGGSLCWPVPEGCPLRFLMVVVVGFCRHRGALCFVAEGWGWGLKEETPSFRGRPPLPSIRRSLS